MTTSGPAARSRRLDVFISDARGRALRTGAAAGLAAWLRRAAPAAVRGHVAIALISDRTMRRLYRTFAGADRVTDVLSFPAEPATSAGRPPTGRHRLLGDVVIARGVATRQARACGHALGIELRVLALHGLLHLIGYDHDTDRGEMARVEERLRRKAGLPSGLIARRPLADRVRHR